MFFPWSTAGLCLLPLAWLKPSECLVDNGRWHCPGRHGEYFMHSVDLYTCAWGLETSVEGMQQWGARWIHYHLCPNELWSLFGLKSKAENYGWYVFFPVEKRLEGESENKPILLSLPSGSWVFHDLNYAGNQSERHLLMLGQVRVPFLTSTFFTTSLLNSYHFTTKMVEG